MLPLRAQILVLLIALVVVGCSAESPLKFPVPEIVEISIADRKVLLDAPQQFMNQPPSAELDAAIFVGTIDNIKVEEFTQKITGEVAEQIGSDTYTSYQGWIYYTPVAHSDSRLYRPVVFCASEGEKFNWNHCQDESWTRLQTADMAKPIRLNGDLSDEQAGQIFKFVDDAGLVSTTDDQLVTADKIYQIIKYAHAGNRVNVYVTTEKKDGSTDVIYLNQSTNADGTTGFSLLNFVCGGLSS